MADQNKPKDREALISVLANKEVEGHMADGAMLARAALMATGRRTCPGKAPTCAPILSDWLAEMRPKGGISRTSIVSGTMCGLALNQHDRERVSIDLAPMASVV